MFDVPNETITLHKAIFESLTQREYKINPITLVIISPGKFQGEKYWAPYLYDCALDHWNWLHTNDYGDSISWLILDDEERALFKNECAIVYERNDGFVHVEFCSELVARNESEKLNNQTMEA